MTHIRQSKPVSGHIRQSKPDSGLSFQVMVLKIFEGVPSSLGSGAVSLLHAEIIRENISFQR